MRRSFAWLIAAPLAVIGMLAGHSVGYRAAVPDAHERAEVLAASGHGYLEYAPLAIALCVAIVGLAFVAAVLDAFGHRDRIGGERQFVLVAAVAPVAFVFQELIERYAHEGHLHWGLVVSAPFLLGLALQLPFALLAAAVAYALASTTRLVAQALGTVRQQRSCTSALRPLSRLSIDLPCEPALAGSCSGRGPPVLT